MIPSRNIRLILCPFLVMEIAILFPPSLSLHLHLLLRCICTMRRKINFSPFGFQFYYRTLPSTHSPQIKYFFSPTYMQIGPTTISCIIYRNSFAALLQWTHFYTRPSVRFASSNHTICSSLNAYCRPRQKWTLFFYWWVEYTHYNPLVIHRIIIIIVIVAPHPPKSTPSIGSGRYYVPLCNGVDKNRFRLRSNFGTMSSLLLWHRIPYQFHRLLVSSSWSENRYYSCSGLNWRQRGRKQSTGAKSVVFVLN